MQFSVLFCKVVVLKVIFLATCGNNNLQWQKIFLNALVETESTHGLVSGWNSAGHHHRATLLCFDFRQFYMLHNSTSNRSLAQYSSFFFFFFPTGLLLTRRRKNKVSTIIILKLYKCILRINTSNKHNKSCKA